MEAFAVLNDSVFYDEFAFDFDRKTWLKFFAEMYGLLSRLN